jgi:hypothetical protein
MGRRSHNGNWRRLSPHFPQACGRRAGGAANVVVSRVRGGGRVAPGGCRCRGGGRVRGDGRSHTDGALGFALAAGVAEDPGWRGIALDGLTQTMGRLGTSLVLGVLWSLWHLPLYFIEGTFQHALGVATPQFWMSMTIRVPFAVLLVWLVTGTDGAIVAAVAAHALGNTVGEVLTTGVAVMGVELLITGLAATAVGTAWGLQGKHRPPISPDRSARRTRGT